MIRAFCVCLTLNTPKPPFSFHNRNKKFEFFNFLCEKAKEDIFLPFFISTNARLCAILVTQH